MEELQGLTLHFEKEKVESTRFAKKGDNFSQAGLILRSLNEIDVRKICGAVVYGAGEQHYLRGRVGKRKFSKNSLSCKLVQDSGTKLPSTVKQRKQPEPTYFEASIALEGNLEKKRFRSYGDCSCPLSREEGSLCEHIAALMIAWIRNPQDFEESKNGKLDFEISKRRVMNSLNDIVGCIEEGGSGIDDDRELLQRTYRKLRLWASEITDERISQPPDLSSGQAIRDFMWAINYVSLAIIFAIGNKYNIPNAIAIYNKNTVSTFGRITETFVQSVDSGKRATPAAVIEKRQKGKLQTSAKSLSKTARSWDAILEDFTGSR